MERSDPIQAKPAAESMVSKVENVQITALRRMSIQDSQLASEATTREQQMTLWQGVKLYPAAIFFSIAVSCCIIMEGYDVNLLAGFYAFPTFQQKYGHATKTGYQLSAAWQSGLSNGAAVGEIFGLFLNGILSERYGYRKTLIGALMAVSCFIFIPFFAPNIQTLQVGEVLCGIPWGVFQTLTVVYASEVCPVPLRAYLTTFVNLCWVLGTLLAAGVLRSLLTRTDEWAYRIPFALQWIWPLPIAVVVFFAPESPWWLVRNDRINDARKALIRLTSAKETAEDVDKTIAMMVHTDALEREISAGTTYWDCFKGSDLRRTEIACITWAIQNLSGSAFMGYSTYFFIQAGLSTDASFSLTVGQYGLGAIGTILSWFLMSYFGRRTLYLAGLASQCLVLVIAGFLALAPDSNTGAKWAIGGMLLAYTLIYDMGVGPVCYSLVAEIPSSRLRTKTVVLARNLYNVVLLVNNVIIPYMLNPSAWNWRAKSGFFWGGLCFCCAVWTYFRLPEPKGRTYGELDILFERGVSAREFAGAVVDPFHGVVELGGDEKVEKLS